jgi:hypothetical protein
MAIAEQDILLKITLYLTQIRRYHVLSAYKFVM